MMLKNIYRRIINPEQRHRIHLRLNRNEVLGWIKTPTYENYDKVSSIFVHIPKTAGTSISMALLGIDVPSHLTIHDYKILFGGVKIKNFFKFTFVRNPWDKILSSYIFLKSMPVDKFPACKIVRNYSDFNIFVKSWINEDNIFLNHHFWPQYHFICGRNLKPNVDFIGYFENLYEDYDYVRHKLNMGGELAHLNKSIKTSNDYHDYYDSETKEIIRNVYEKDIELFGYEF
tara:strand:+ start:4855 stop:5544 length:690 start_codon:yes stop_codon:yes gene_type:complete